VTTTRFDPVSAMPLLCTTAFKLAQHILRDLSLWYGRLQNDDVKEFGRHLTRID
jgi:hypothetical protein